MATAVHLEGGYDNTRIALVVRGAVVLAVIQAVVVVIISIVNKSLDGAPDHALTGGFVFLGAMITIFYPGTLTRPRSIDGMLSMPRPMAGEDALNW